MDEHYHIEEFFPYYQYERFDFVDESRSLFADVGKVGLVAFRSVEGDIWCGEPHGTNDYLKQHAATLDEFPLLKLQLLRIARAPLAQQYEAWRSTSEKYFTAASQKTHWLEAELLSFQSTDKIWNRIRSKELPKDAPQSLVSDETAAMDAEELFGVLSDPENFEVGGWDVVWFKLKDMLPIDERIYHLANEWLFAVLGSNLAVGRTRHVLAEALRFWRSVGYDGDKTQFSEFILELIRSGEFFSDELGLSFSSVMAGLELGGYELSDEDYLAMLLQVLAEHYFSAAQTEALLLHIEGVAQPEKVSAADIWPARPAGEFIWVEAWKDAAAKNQRALKAVLDRLHLLDSKLPGVRAFRRKWKPLLQMARQSD
ncbi:MAG: hypothetical protein JHD07_21250 [Bradyrhizobium sp.]|uniref:hypothetical protein n=1 Tax=Bradyrhizobium sp. TaxID=376 RepID=UPI001A1CE5BB|nr:hypothetical protein [Bradyrhizobium sp.]MBJ7405691.1 hypothetical protein [Bradyrhizobium sp.]